MTRSISAALLMAMLWGGPAMAQNMEPPASAPAARPADEMGWMRRQALIVTDMDRAMSLYSGILGFKSNGVTQSLPTSYSYDVFNIPRTAKIRFSTLDGRDGQQRSLALIEVTGKGAVLPKAKGIRPTAAVINTRRLDWVQAQVKALGLTAIPERELKRSDGTVGREWAFLDWDGHLVVLYQFPGE
jgi:catechol 2,3-dioxygenase-like lactoylglutathione lyase family enzyme